jgi:hypothetical protein
VSFQEKSVIAITGALLAGILAELVEGATGIVLYRQDT